MGFYGNITNVNKSTFQFDKIYPNRREMDISCASDGVFIGRYVLVDYDEESVASYVHSQLDEEYQNRPVVVGYQEKRRTGQNQYQILNDKFYSGIPRVSDDGSKIETDRLYVIGSSTEGISVQPGTLLLNVGYVITEQTIAGDPPSISWVVEFDKEGSDPNKGFIPKVYLADESSSNFVLLTEIDNNSAIWNYHDKFVINHNIDAKFYGGEIGRGWDSTVWQKVYRDGTVSYVMIAELNSVVPTFDIQADSPVLPSEPWRQKPYYDADSSNVYYKLHWPSAWGFRIKASEDNTYSDGIYYPSDEQGEYYTKESYNANKDLAIYWFKDGFHKYLISEPETTENKLKLTPTGKSGNEYWDNQTQTIKEAVDIYELSMMLPTIGETVSKLWDVVYGKGEYKDTLGNRLWNKAAFDLNEGGDLIVAHEPKNEYDDNIKIRNTNLQWNTRNGVRAYWENDSEEVAKLTYNKTAYNTLAGTINSVHDLVGMIIIEDDNLFAEENNQRIIDPAKVDPNNIYYDKTTGKYYRKGKKYLFDNDNLVSISGSNMFNPRDGFHYRLESFAFDNYDDIYSQNKESNEPIFENIANNYYKVGQNDNTYENEVYGTISADLIDLNQLNPENFDPENNDIWWLNENSNKIGYSLGDYTRENRVRPQDNVRYYSLTATEIEYPNKPVFYQPKKYYLMKKYFSDIPNGATKESQREAWETSLLNNNTDFDYLKLMTRSTLSAEEAALESEEFLLNQENPPRTVGYRILSGVAIDPNRSIYQITDENRRKGEKILLPEYWENVLENEGKEYPITTEYDEEHDITLYYYNWNDYSTELLKVVIIEENNAQYYQYDTTVFTSEEHLELGSKSLLQWELYVNDPNNNVTEDDFKDLYPDEHFVRELIDPFYTLVNATDITNNLEEFGADGSTQYYYYNINPSSHNGQPWYSVITKADFDANQGQGQDSLWTQSWWTLATEPLPLYYDLNKGYYISEYSYNIIENHEDLIEGKEYFIYNDENDSYSAIAYNEINEQTEVYERIVVKYLRETAPLIFDEDKNDPNCPDYYLVRFTPESTTPFIPNLYYYLNNGEYELAQSYDPSKTYYRYIDRYVTNDPNGVYDLGARWNEEVSIQDTGITVKGKTFEWEFQELPGFAEDMSTLHGLILKINQMLLAGDSVTRDNSTVQGCINLINDILDKFDQLKPAEIVMVDKLGRIHSGDWDSKQKSGYSNIGKPSANVAVPAGDPVAADNERWLRLTTTPGTGNNDYKPHIKLEHTFKAAEDTDTTADKNNSNGDGLNKGSNDVLKLYTPIVDNMGHIVGNNTETVTLPYGFKTITGNGGSLIADNTKDTAAFNGDTWIQTTASSNGVAFTHIGPDENNLHSGNYITAVSPMFGKTFSIDDWSFDQKGHQSTQGSHLVTIPAPDISGTGNVVNSATLDSNGNFALTKVNVGTLALTGLAGTGYDATTNLVPTETDSLNTALDKMMGILDNSAVSVNTRIINLITALDTTVTASGASSEQNVTPNSTVNVVSGITQTDALLTGVNSVLVDAAGAAAAVIGSSTDTYEQLTLYGVKKYVDARVSESIISDNFWGVQTPIASDVSIPTAMSITGSMTDANVIAVPLANNGEITYGTAYYLLNNNGQIEIQTSGLYKVHGSLVITTPQNCMAKAWIGKDHSGTLTSISGVSEYTGAGGSAAQILSFSDRLVQLEAGDIIVLRAGCSATGATVKQNDLSYILLEMIKSNGNVGGE